MSKRIFLRPEFATARARRRNSTLLQPKRARARSRAFSASVSRCTRSCRWSEREDQLARGRGRFQRQRAIGTACRLASTEHSNGSARRLDADARICGIGRDKPAIVCGDETVTYAELPSQIARYATALAALGLAPEQRLLLFGTDSLDYVTLWLGSVRLGAIPVVISDLYKPKDLAYFLTTRQCSSCSSTQNSCKSCSTSRATCHLR